MWVAQRYLSYFQGPLTPANDHVANCADQRQLRGVVPANRLRVYDMKTVITLIADTDSVLFLRQGYGVGVHTALVRVGGRSVGVIANSPLHLGGAIDTEAALKGARFMELCDAFDIPILSLVDCPGFMVGPSSEREASVRKFSRLFVIGASITVPFFTVYTRKGYGLGAMAMAGGNNMGRETFCVAWPTGEFGGMGLEGAAKLGYAKQLEKARQAGGVAAEKVLYTKLLGAMYEKGRALSNTMEGELDDTIDPAETRRWVLMGLDLAAPDAAARKRRGKKRPGISTW